MTTPTTIPCATCNRRIDVSNCGPALIAYFAQRHERCLACLQLGTCPRCERGVTSAMDVTHDFGSAWHTYCHAAADEHYARHGKRALGDPRP